MSNAAVHCEGLGKRFRLGEEGAGNSLREFLEHHVRRRVAPRTMRTVERRFEGGGARRWVWALRDIQFTLQTGFVHGIVGANGAGKSVLLKILSRVTRPSEGWADVRGRVVSLLEASAGFHPELTGRENVFFVGTLLGRSKADVDSLFDDIAAFSGVESFLDTPVKRYSNGMKTRLAFSVGVHLEPELLILDEALSVEDVDFRDRSLTRMREHAAQGGTVLFVSHDMPAITAVCHDALYLSKGELVAHGPAGPVVEQYTRDQLQRDSAS
jgi:lipopolysaccharide transport system ATP-binding protein